MHEGLEHPFNSTLFPRVVPGNFQRSLCPFFGARGLLFDVQHIEFRPKFCAFCMWPKSEFPQSRFKLKDDVRDKQVALDALFGGRLPGEQTQAENQFVFLAKPDLFLMDGKERGIDLVDYFPLDMFFRPR